MNPQELIDHCRKRQEIDKKYGSSNWQQALVSLKIKAPPNWSGQGRRLFGRSGPIGTVVDWSRDGQLVVLFKADAVIKFIEKELKKLCYCDSCNGEEPHK